MKTLATLIFFLLGLQCWAQPPSYDYLRKTVQEQDPKDKTPAAERIFVSYNYKDGVIIRFHDGITLREIIDQSTRRGKAVQVRILRSPDNKTRAVFDRAIEPHHKPSFIIKPQDVVFLQEPYTPDA